MPAFLRVVVLLGVFYILFGIQYDTYAQEGENEIYQKTKKVDIQAFDLSATLQELAYLYETPIGFESGPNDKSDKQNVKIERATLQEALDSLITKSNPAYTWEVSDGVINVYPKEDRDAVLQSVLNVKIEEFTINGEVSPLELRSRLTNLPEVRAEMSNYGVRPLNLEFVSARTKKAFKLKISEKNKSLKRLLNKIVKMTGRNFWIASRYGEQREFLIINL